jgi:hypothetical protein
VPQPAQAPEPAGNHEKAAIGWGKVIAVPIAVAIGMAIGYIVIRRVHSFDSNR